MADLTTILANGSAVVGAVVDGGQTMTEWPFNLIITVGLTLLGLRIGKSWLKFKRA